MLVDRKPLVDQWRQRLGEHLGAGSGQVGVIGGGVDHPTGIVDVAMIQSLTRREQPGAVFERYGLIVVDECHHLPAVSFEGCVRHAPSRRWLGLTATPYRRDGLEGIITLQCGPTRFELATKASNVHELVHRELIVHETRSEVPEDGAASNPGRVRGDCRGRVPHRTDLRRRPPSRHGRADLSRAHAAHRPHLCHRRRARPARRQGARAAGWAREASQDAVGNAIASRPEGSGIVLVATGSYLGEGFDWPELDTLFLAFPIAFKGRVVQYVGRLLRAYGGKYHVELHDYVDVRIPVLDRMHTKRLPAYATLGFDVPRGRTRHTTRPPTTTPDLTT